MFYPFDPSSTLVRNSLKQYTSGSTKLTTANWSPDHTSRAPSPLTENPASPVISKLQSHIEELNIYLKYFKDLSFQLRNNLDSEINKLNIKRSEIIANIEMNFSNSINELRMKHNEKNVKLIKNIKEISNEIHKNLQVIDQIAVGKEVEVDFLDHLLQFSFQKERFDEDWLKIRTSEEDKGFGAGNKARSSGEFTTGLLSTLYTEATCKCEHENSKIRVYVPYGSPLYSFYYLVKLGKGFKVGDLISSLQNIWGREKKLWISLKPSEKEAEQQLMPFESLPNKIKDSWPRLYVKFD